MGRKVTDPNGNPVEVPERTTGKELKEKFNLPPNNILSRVGEDGSEKVVKNDEQLDVREGDRFDESSAFRRGSSEKTENENN